jgi:hypothetical protein
MTNLFHLFIGNDLNIPFRIWTSNELRYLVHVATYQNIVLRQINKYNFSQRMDVK